MNKLDDNELLALKEFGLMAYALKHGRNKNDIIPYIRKLVPELGAFDKSEDGRQYNIKLITYLLKVGKSADKQALFATMSRLSTKTKEGIMSIADDIFNEGEAKGITEGIAKGITEGIAKGEHKILSRQIERRFGKLTPELAKRLQALAEHELEQVGDRILEATCLEDVFPNKKH